MKIVKWFGIVLAVLVVLAGAGVVAFKLKGPNSRPAQDLKVDSSPETLARGEYLFSHVMACAHCHSEEQKDRWGMPPRPEKFAAGRCLSEQEANGFPGKLCVSNITSHPTSGIGGWTDGEILRAIREGIGRDGRALFPMMPYGDYKSLSDEDAHALVAFVRTIPAIDNAVPQLEVNFPVSLFIQLAPEPVVGPVNAPARSDAAAYGKYLTTVGGCAHCHTPMGDDHKPVPGKAFGGGQELPLGKTILRSANITFHSTGLAGRSKEAFITGFRTWANEELRNQPVDPSENTLMPWQNYSEMTDEDLGAIYEYLRTVPPVENAVVKYSPVMTANP